MKIGLLFVACLIPAICNAGAGMPCEKIGYAELKDSTRAELVDGYCSALRRSKLNRGMLEISKETAHEKMAIGMDSQKEIDDMKQESKAEVSCAGAAEDASKMLMKKFRAKPPSCK